MCLWKIKNIFELDDFKEEINISGWIRNKRSSKDFGFLNINDGSCLKNLQVFIDFKKNDRDIFDKINIGSSVSIAGFIQQSLGSKQNIELCANKINIICEAKEYPLQAKKHSFDFLREISNLRIRTNTFSSVFRVRNAISFAIHNFFQEKNFIYINTPIITGNDCEGAGEIFTVTSLNLKNVDKAISFEDDFFGKHVGLTVSGQLEAETAIFGLGKVYTFGPTFRAENSNTTRHLAEFWMVEPEVAFNDLNDNIALAENFLKYVIKYSINNCKDELDFLNEKYNKNRGEDLILKLKNIINNDFVRITYTEAIDILKKSKENFKYKITEWGCDLQSEHERFLVEKYFNNIPVIVTDYPEKIKAFYMRLNDDKKTVAAMDVLFPGIGEIIGGGQREERLDFLIKAIKNRKMDEKMIDWYVDTRRFGSVIHSGFGLGLERLIQFITGIDNIRDVILYPRYPKHSDC